MHRTVPTAENWLAASGSSARLEKCRVSAACGWVSPTKRAPLMSSFQPVSQNGTVSSLKAFSVLLILKCSSKIIFFRELIKPIWLQPPPHTFFTEHLWVGGGTLWRTPPSALLETGKTHGKLWPGLTLKWLTPTPYSFLLSEERCSVTMEYAKKDIWLRRVKAP